MTIVSVRVKRHRKPSLSAALKQAAKAGQAVKGAVIRADAIELQFGEPEATNTNANPWDEVLRHEPH